MLPDELVVEEFDVQSNVAYRVGLKDVSEVLG
jgi:hypothetical protein